MRPVLEVEPAPLLVKTSHKTILLLPFGVRDGHRQMGDFDEDQLQLQQQHNFYMPSGYLSRVGKTVWQRFSTSPFYTHLVALQNDSISHDGSTRFWQTIQKENIDAVYASHEYFKKHPLLKNVLTNTSLNMLSDDNGVLIEL